MRQLKFLVLTDLESNSDIQLRRWMFLELNFNNTENKSQSSFFQILLANYFQILFLIK